MDGFRKIKSSQINDNPFKLIGADWMLITAGTVESLNTMTASWGGLGVLWNLPVATVYVRPSRHTFQFIEENPVYTISFFDESFRSALNFCGSHSGRDTDKITGTGLIPAATENGSVSFKQARLVIECGKLYHHDIDPSKFLDPDIAKHYPTPDYHREYIGRILSVYEK
jgi:flavin reductase (DIM6/NTAB) family NADH-FMN oxidoreductase RutF